MISDKMQAAIHEQMSAEFYSAYLYLAMAAYCESRNLKGFAAWLMLQEAEERAHAMKFFRHLLDRGGSVRLKAIAEPPAEYRSLEDVFSQVCEHEKGVTRRIQDLYELGANEKDYAAQVLLQWFITEQVEEEASASEMLENIRMVADSSEGIFLLDQKAGQRTASAPAE